MANEKGMSDKFISMARTGGGGPGRRQVERVKLKDTKQTIKRLWGYLYKNRIALIIAFLFVIANSVLTILATYMVRPILNNLVDGQAQALVGSLLVMAFIYILAVLSNYIQSRLMLEIAQKSLEDIRLDLYHKLQKLPLHYFDSNNNGDVMSRFTNDVDSISQMLSSTCVQLVSAIVTLITTFMIMIYTSWILSIVTCCIVPLFTLVSKEISKRSMRYYKEQQASIGALNSYIEESISGQKVVKVFNHEEKAISEFEVLNQNYRMRSFNAQFLGGIMGPVLGSLSLLCYSVTAFAGGLLCVFTGFDIGGYAIFVNYSKSFSRPISDISNQINTIFAALAGAERVFEVMDEKPEVCDEKEAKQVEKIIGEVEFKNVSFGYRPQKMVLKHISLYAKAGQKVAFVGSTGAGKTTITNLINRFYDINEGDITIDKVDIKHYHKDFLRQNIAMVLQDTHLFTGTVMENIRYGRLDANDEEVIAAAEAANADKFIRRLDQGYQTVLEGDGANLSQGQRQLLNIARAAISKVPILVLDEATSSVDTRTERHIEQALDRLMSERTTFVIAHRLSTVRNSDVIMVLENGEIIERGNHQALLDLKGTYYNLCTGLRKLS